jgi:transposase
LEILLKVKEQKKLLQENILFAGKAFESQVKLLISIKGISVLTALAFLSDVGDMSRFRTARKMNSYLGLVPQLRESGNSSKAGHINRASRKTTRTLLTQSLIQAMFACGGPKKLSVPRRDSRCQRFSLAVQHNRNGQS